MKIFRNTAAVLVLTLFTGLAVFTTIQLGDRLFGTPDASAQTMSAQSSSAIEQSGDDYYGDDYSDDGNGAYVDPYGAGQSADPERSELRRARLDGYHADVPGDRLQRLELPRDASARRPGCWRSWPRPGPGRLPPPRAGLALGEERRAPSVRKREGCA